MNGGPRAHYERTRYPIEFLAPHEVCRCTRIAGRHGIGHPHIITSSSVYPHEAQPATIPDPKGE